MLKKTMLLAFAPFLCFGCAWRPQVSDGAQSAVARGVRFTAAKPAPSCAFKGGILGDVNPDADGLLSSVLELNDDIRRDLASGAKNMGGNTVWVRGTDWRNPKYATDYYQDFYVNNVEYSALVYDCPAE